VVAVVAAGMVSGCSGSKSEARAATPSPPGTATKDQAAKDSAALLARYDTAAATYPALAGKLAPLRAEVAQHVRAFGGTPAAAPVPASPSPQPTTSMGPTSLPTAPAKTPAQALADLAGAERELADSRTRTLLDAPAELARLLASVAASGAGHAALLGAGTA
jgi:hypothetical protein